MSPKTLKPDYSVPGLNYRRETGQLKGKLYTVMPRRFKSAGGNAFKTGIAAVLVFWGLFALDGSEYGFFEAGFFFILIFALSYPVFVLYDPGKRIRITKDQIKIGMSRYDPNAAGSFYKIHYTNAKNEITGYCIGFRYGTREVEIPIFNNQGIIDTLIPFLNDAREAIASETAPKAAQPASAASLRSAEF